MLAEESTEGDAEEMYREVVDIPRDVMGTYKLMRLINRYSEGEVILCDSELGRTSNTNLISKLLMQKRCMNLANSASGEKIKQMERDNPGIREEYVRERNRNNYTG